MKKTFFLFLLIYTFSASVFYAQSFAYGDYWYDNPLGFDPVNLHTKNGFLLPAIAVGACLLLTEADSLLTDKLSLYNESGISWGYKYPYASVFQTNIGVQYYLRNWVSIGADLGFYFPRDAYNSAGGIALRPFARFYPVNNALWRVYFESGAGLIYFTEEFPRPTVQDSRIGTNLNGTSKYGIGAEINFTKTVSVLFGLRHVHVSNGNTSGAERNPSHDSNGFFIGFIYRPDNKN